MKIKTKQKISNFFYLFFSAICKKTWISLFQGSGKVDKFGNISILRDFFQESGHKIKIIYKPSSLFEYIKLSFILSKTKVLVIDSQSPAAYIKVSRKTYIVNVWHASGAYKTLGFDTIRDNSDKDHEEVRIQRIFSRTDYFICSSPEQAKIYAQALKLPLNKFIPLGIPRTDKYISDNQSNHLKKNKNKISVLYAPTFRGRKKRSNVVLLKKVIDTFKSRNDIEIAYRGHPTTQVNKIENINNVSNKQLDEIIYSFDVLITDYSSILFDFLLIDKPFILYVPDLEDYTTNEFPLYFDPGEIAPGYVARTETEIINLIEKICIYKKYNINYKLKKMMLSSCDGQSTKRVAEFIESLTEK